MSHIPTAERSTGEATLRRAGPDDAPALAALRYTFRTLDYPGERGTFEERAAFLPRCVPWMRTRLRARGEQDGNAWRCWVVERADGTLGDQLWLQAIEKIPNPAAEPELHAYVTNVYVEPELRGRGLAGALLDRALAWCREQAVDQVILWPSPKSRPLYARHGFAVSDATMVAPVDPEG